MVVRCAVPGCKTKGTSGFYSFPANETVRKEWIVRTKVFHLDKEKIVRSWSKVCGKHFNESDFVINFNGKKNLKPKTVPTLFLPNIVDTTLADHNYARRDPQVSETNLKF